MIKIVKMVSEIIKLLVVQVIDTVQVAAINYDEDLLCDMHGVEFPPSKVTLDQLLSEL